MRKYKAIRLHRRLWQWLADNPAKDKKDWPEWSFQGGTIYWVTQFCFACQMTQYDEIRPFMLSCSKCLFVWPGISCVDNEYCDDLQGLFNLWRYESNLNKRREYALEIKNLPINKNWEKRKYSCGHVWTQRATAIKVKESYPERIILH